MIRIKVTRDGNASKVHVEGHGTYLVSYETVVAFRSTAGHVTLDERSWDPTLATSKHRNEFLGEPVKLTRQKIKSGEYEFADLRIEADR